MLWKADNRWRPIHRNESFHIKVVKIIKITFSSFILTWFTINYLQLNWRWNCNSSTIIDRLNGHLVSTYESASTRRFSLGRVDNIRAASCEALEWCKSMSSDETDTRRLQLLREAMQAQTEIMVQVCMCLDKLIIIVL